MVEVNTWVCDAKTKVAEKKKVEREPAPALPAPKEINIEKLYDEAKAKGWNV